MRLPVAYDTYIQSLIEAVVLLLGPLQSEGEHGITSRFLHQHFGAYSAENIKNFRFAIT